MNRASAAPDPAALEVPIDPAALRARQLAMLMGNAPANIVLSFLLACFVALVFGELIDGRAVSWWWLAMVVLLFVQYLAYVFWRGRGAQDAAEPWLRLQALLVGIGGLLWSAGVLLLFERIPEAYHVFLIILLVSLGAAGVTLAVDVWVYLAFQLAVQVPAVVWLLLDDDFLHRILGVFLAIFTVAMWLFANQIARTLRQAFVQQLHNEALAQSLRQSNARLHVLNEELRQLSATDSLTEVANRRYFEDRYNAEFSRASRDGSHLSLIMIDVDHFKAFNDELGHVEGDHCLRRLALRIRDSLKRPTDLVARYGGEEFIVLLPATPLEGAAALAEEIRNNVRALAIPHPSSTTGPHVTVSLGVTGAVPDRRMGRDALLRRVDEALYAAKAAGRDRVVVLPLDESSPED